MTSRIRWSNQIRRYLAPWLCEKVQGSKSKPSIRVEALEDRTVPAYIPALGWGESYGDANQDPDIVTNSNNSTPCDPLSLTGNFYESVNAVNPQGVILSGTGGAHLFNTDGPAISINGGKIIFGNPLEVSLESNDVVFDAAGPVATLTQAPINFNITNSGGHSNFFQVTFTDPASIDPTSITTENYTVDNGATVTSVHYDPATGMVTYIIDGNGVNWALSNQGLYTITPASDPANLPKDLLGNTATLPSTSFTVDTVAPEVTSIGFTESDPTNEPELTVEIEFSKPVTFRDPGDHFRNLFYYGGGFVTGMTQIDSTHFSVTIDPDFGGRGAHLVFLQVLSGAATDDAANPNPASAMATITFNNLGPHLEVQVQGLTNNTTKQQTVTVVVNVNPASAYNFFNQPEAGIVLTNATYVAGSFTPVSGVNGQYQFQIMATNPGLVTVGMAEETFTDDVGNGNNQTTVEYQYRVALTVELTSPDVVQGGTTTDNTLSFTAMFNGAIEDFDPTNFFTVSNATITNLTQAPFPAWFTFNVTPTTRGPVSVQVNAGVATDELGLTNEASTPFTFDHKIVVTSTLSMKATAITSQKTIPVTLTFSEAVTGLDATNFLSKFTATGGTLDPNYFVANPNGTTFEVLLRPNGVTGSSVPVPVSLQFHDGAVTPSNEASNTLALTYITQMGVLGLGTGGLAYLDKADGTVLTIDVYPGFTGGVRVASGNYAITGSDTLDLLAGAGPGGAPHVKVINGNTGHTGAVAASFYAFSTSFSGGVFVASGDVNGDGFNDFVVAAGPGGGPHVKVFSGNPTDFVNGKPTAFASFFAYASAFQGGVTVAVADINGDGYGDVITGTAGGSPHVIVFSGASLALNQKLALASYYSGSPTSTAGVFVGAGDLGADGTIQIFTGTGAGVVGVVNIVTLEQQGTDDYYVVNPSLTHTIQPYGNFTGGVRVSTVDGYLLTGPGKGGGPNIRVFDPLNDYTLVDSFFFPDNPDYLGGVFIG